MDNTQFSHMTISQEPADFEKSEQWNSLLDLTYAVWRVCDMTVENEFLKSRVKQTAADILTDYAAASFPTRYTPPFAHGQSASLTEQLSSAINGQRAGQAEKLTEKVNAQIALLSLAQRISGAKEINFMILKNEYKRFGSLLSRMMAFHEAEKKSPEPDSATVQAEQGAEVGLSLGRGAEVELPLGSSTSKSELEREAAMRHAPARKTASDAAMKTLNDRQIKIVQFFTKSKENKIKLKSIAHVFPQLTDRTIRNDLKDLCGKKIVARSDGFGQSSYYFLVKR